MKITIYRADCCGNTAGYAYPIKVEACNKDEMKDAVSFDHVCVEYKGNTCSNNNFIRSDTVIMNIDNNCSENPEIWFTDKILEEIMPDISYALVPSRHFVVSKDNTTLRPKYHVYFPIKEITDKNAYSGLKREIRKVYPFLNENTSDIASFVLNPNSEDIVWHEGRINIDEDIETNTVDDIKLASIGDYTDFFYNNHHSQNSCVYTGKYNNNFKPTDYSDIGQAKALVRKYGNELTYTDASEYMRYDGTRWVESRHLAIGVCEEFLDLQLQDALNATAAAKGTLIKSGVDEKIVTAGGSVLEKLVGGDKQQNLLAAYLASKQYLSFVMKRRDMKYITSMLQAAKPMVLKNIKDFDNKPFLLNTPTSTYDLTLGLNGAREHSAKDFITKQTAVSVSDEGKKLWIDAVNSFFCGDTGLIDYVQKIVGLAAIGKVYAEALIISYGEGSNGKSTFWNTISGVLGSYSGSLSSDALTVGCKRNVKPEMAELKGKRLVIAAELEEGMRLNTATVKKLCSTDEIVAEKKYKDPFKFTPTHTLVLYTNHLPKVGASDAGTWRRLIVIPFNAKIKGNKDIKNYSDYLVQNAGGAVLSWIIEGAKKVIDSDFRIEPPMCVQEAIDRYHESNDWLSIFLEDCCEIDPSYTQKSGEFYQEYRTYCQRTGEYTRSTTDFYTALETAGFIRKRQRTGNIICGLQLKSDFLDE